ncbi:MAG: FAD:protein FMN transferase [Hyphomicrobiales bacterium]|nr:FAD:protein FMN transferase [Hyphomicrobiales bacterium]
MGTIYHLSIAERSLGVDRSALQAGVESILDGVNEAMSTYRSHSELSRINDSMSTTWTPVSTDIETVLEEALRVSRLSGGAFDPTVGPLVSFWGFGPERGGLPEQPERNVDRIAERVSYRQVHLRHSPPAMRKDRDGVQIDLFGVAKGFALDKVGTYLREAGFHNFLFEIGGEILAAGRNRRGEPWRVGIEKPVVGEIAIQRVVGLEDTAIATSGNYRIFAERAGQRYSHLIDPRTGKPVTHRLASVSVIDPSTMRADALSTALMVLGPQAGPLLAKEEGIATLSIIRTGAGFREIASPAFARYLTDQSSLREKPA